MEHLQKLTAVLSDPTRFSIYQYITDKQESMTVLDISEHFSIHPNVARLHLTKLENCQLLESTTEKNKKGGRPSRLYALSKKTVNYSFPFRDYPLLADLALKSLLTLGEEGKKALYQIGVSYGRNVAQQSLVSFNLKTLTMDKRYALLSSLSAFTGLATQFVRHLDTQEIHYQVHNCPFVDLLTDDSEQHLLICKMHSGIFEGIATTLFPDSTLLQENIRDDQCKHCAYRLKLHN